MAPHTYQDPIGFYEWFDDLPYAIQDSILKHLPHMEGEEWLIVIILAALLLMILVSAYLGFARHNVKKTSERLNALKELNNTTEFMPVEAQYRYYLRSDTKLEYEEFSLPKFFRREVRENFKLYNTLLGNARANTVLYETYGREIQELPDWTESDDDCGRHIPFFLYHNIEKELYDETVLDCPVTSPEFVCTKSYLPKDAKEPIETEETYTLEELEEYIRRLKVAADLPVPAGEEAEKPVSFAVQLLIFGLCVVVAVGITAYSIFSNLVLTSDNMTLKARVSDLSYAQNIYDVYNQTKKDYDWTKLLESASSNKNDEITGFVDELEQKLPSEAKLVNMSVTTDGVSMTIKTGSKDIAADVIAQLRTFESIMVSNVSTITEEVDETGASKVQFTVDCTYVKADDSAASESADGTGSEPDDTSKDASSQAQTDSNSSSDTDSTNQ